MIVEIGATEPVLTAPRHPYTQALLSALPVPDPDAAHRNRTVLSGDLPSPADPPVGCRFQTRCPKFRTLTDAERRICTSQPPPLRPLGDTDHQSPATTVNRQDAIQGKAAAPAPTATRLPHRPATTPW